MACKGNARPEDHWDHGNERAAERGTEQKKSRCREGSEGDVKRELDPASEDSGQEKKCRYDEDAPHEERLRVVEKEPPERGGQTGKSDPEKYRPLGGFRGVDIRPSLATHLTEHEHCDRDNDSDDDEKHRLDRGARRLAHSRNANQ